MMTTIFISIELIMYLIVLFTNLSKTNPGKPLVVLINTAMAIFAVLLLAGVLK